MGEKWASFSRTSNSWFNCIDSDSGATLGGILDEISGRCH